MILVLLKHTLTSFFTELSYGREAKLLCKKIVAFFALLSKTQETGVRKLGVTQELLSLVTGLAHYLKLLIRIGLQGALKLEREKSAPDGLHNFLEHLRDLESLAQMDDENAPLDLMAGVEGLADQLSDCCISCKEPIDDECVLLGQSRWHIKPPHLSCVACEKDLTVDLQGALWSASEEKAYCDDCAHQQNLGSAVQSGFIPVSKLQQFIFLLKVALFLNQEIEINAEDALLLSALLSILEGSSKDIPYGGFAGLNQRKQLLHVEMTFNQLFHL